MKSEIILNEIKNEIKDFKKNQTVKTILFIVIAIAAAGTAAALIIMKFRNELKNIDFDELTADDYNYEYDDDDLFDIADYDEAYDDDLFEEE